MVAESERGVVVVGGCTSNVVHYCMLCSLRQSVITMESLETKNGVSYARIYCMRLRPEVRRQLSRVLAGRCSHRKAKKRVRFDLVVTVRYVPWQNKGEEAEERK